MLLVVNNFYPFFHEECKRWFTPGFHRINKVYRRNYYFKYNLGILLWDWFLCKIFSKVSSKRVQIFTVLYLLGYILEVFLQNVCVCNFSIYNREIVTTFACNFVNNTTFFKHLPLYSYLPFTFAFKFQFQPTLTKYFNTKPFLSLLTKCPCISPTNFRNL